MGQKDHATQALRITSQQHLNQQGLEHHAQFQQVQESSTDALNRHLNFGSNNAHMHLQEHSNYSTVLDEHLQELRIQQQQIEESLDYSELRDYDLKSRDSKYRRWTPKMDQFLIKLLSDIVHSYRKGYEVEMTKKAWAYLTGQLRAANPETVYSTYTKYSCQQHLINVNHHRYKIWYVLMLHQKNNNSPHGYSYRWNPEAGRFQIIDNSNNSLILDDRQVKSLLYSESLSLPSLSSFNKGNLIVNDFFLSDNLKYMSVYHNEILPLLVRLDPKYAEGLGEVYNEIPKFDFSEANNEYFKPLIPAKATKPVQITQETTNEESAQRRGTVEIQRNTNDTKKRPRSDNNSSSPAQLRFKDTEPHDDSVDPMLKRSNNGQTSSVTTQVAAASAQLAQAAASATSNIDFENALALAAIAAINSPPVVNVRDSIPFYVKDRKWFYKLISLNESGLLGVEEVLALCEGIRDTKVPMFMLNVLDPEYYPSRNNSVIPEEYTDEEIAKQIRKFILPMVYNG